MKLIEGTVLTVFLIGISVVNLGEVLAGEPKFQNNAQEIIEALKSAKERSYPVNTSDDALRTIEPEYEEKIDPGYEEGQTAMLKIEFDTGSYIIRPHSYQLLRELGKALTSPELKNRQFAINGHTDSDGDRNYNLKLSLNRALMIKSYLIGNYSISPSRLRPLGYGETNPLVRNNSIKNKQINRRVEIQVLQNQ